jgi:hypothetical protein
MSLEVPQLAHGARTGEQDATAALAVDDRWDGLLFRGLRLVPRPPETSTLSDRQSGMLQAHAQHAAAQQHASSK